MILFDYYILDYYYNYYNNNIRDHMTWYMVL